MNLDEIDNRPIGVGSFVEFNKSTSKIWRGVVVEVGLELLVIMRLAPVYAEGGLVRCKIGSTWAAPISLLNKITPRKALDADYESSDLSDSGWLDLPGLWDDVDLIDYWYGADRWRRSLHSHLENVRAIKATFGIGSQFPQTTTPQTTTPQTTTPDPGLTTKKKKGKILS